MVIACTSCNNPIDPHKQTCQMCGLVQSFFELGNDFSNYTNVSVSHSIITGTSKMARKNNYSSLTVDKNKPLSDYISNLINQIGQSHGYDNIIFTLVEKIMNDCVYRSNTKKAIVLVVIHYIHMYFDIELDPINVYSQKLELNSKFITKGIKIVTNYVHMYLPDYKKYLVPKQNFEELLTQNGMTHLRKTIDDLYCHTLNSITEQKDTTKKGILWYVINSKSKDEYEYTLDEYCKLFKVTYNTVVRVSDKITEIHKNELV